MSVRNILQNILPDVLVDMVLDYHVPAFYKNVETPSQNQQWKYNPHTILLWDGLAALPLDRGRLLLFDFQTGDTRGEFQHVGLENAWDIKPIRDKNSQWYQGLLVLTRERNLLALKLEPFFENTWHGLQSTKLDKVEYLSDNHIVLGSSSLEYGSYIYKTNLSSLKSTELDEQSLQPWTVTFNWTVGDFVFMSERRWLIVLETTFHQVFCLDCNGKVLSKLSYQLVWFPKGIFPTWEGQVEVNDSGQFNLLDCY